MLRRSLFACALMLASVVGFASSAKAETADVKFTGGVVAICTIGDPTIGTKTGSLTPDVGNTKLTSNTTANVKLDCTGGLLTIGAPVSGANPTPTSNKAQILTAGNTTVYSQATDGITSKRLATGDAGDAKISMEATPTAPATTLAAGPYEYTVTVTAVP